MPIEQFLPSIDDRRFDDIVEELRTRVPRYTPEWTDLNDNDPGIAVAQLFAWLAEMLLVRLDQIPRRNQLKFLQLLGIELTPAAPARAEITFPVLPAHPRPFVDVPERTQVAAAGAPGEPPVIFETRRALVALRARLAAVQTFDGYDHRWLPTATEGVEEFEPFGARAAPDAALMLGFEDTGPLPRVALTLTVWAPAGRADASSVSCGAARPPAVASAEIVWEAWGTAGWTELRLLKDETNALTRSGEIVIRTPEEGVMTAAILGNVSRPLFWIRGRIVRAAYERPPTLLAVRANTVGAEQAQTVRDEVLGGSDGRPHQTFTLANTPVLQDTLQIEVRSPRDAERFVAADDFLGSGPRDNHFVLNRTTGRVLFGDGERGAIPLPNPQNRTGNVVALLYRFGGGSRGNVAARALTSLLTSVAGVDENAVTNIRAAFGGRDEESLEVAIQRAPATLKSKCRAVTTEDFEHLAREAATVKRAMALPLTHPDFPDVQVPGVVTVIVVPDSDDPNDRAPTPSEGTLRTVCAYLDQRRLLTTEVYVVKPTYRRVEITVDVVVADGADLGEVRQAVEQALLDYVHPLRGGEDGQGWPFGGDVYFSRVFQRAQVPGVTRVERVVIALDGDEAPVCQDVPVAAGVLLYSTVHNVGVRYADEDSA